MVRGSRRKAETRLFFLAIPFLLFACSGKQAIREEPPRAASAESLLFLSAVQGNPVCMVVDISKRRSSSLLFFPRTKWQLNAWLVSPGTSTYLYTKKGKSKKGALAPLYWKNKQLLFTTDKDEFLFYFPSQAEDLLLLTDPLFADRLRSGQEEIRYGRMPARIFWNNRTVEGNLYYEHRAWLDPPAHGRKGPFLGLEPGGRIFAVWGPDGEFLYLDKGAGIGEERQAGFAVMQDRRGRWQETYQVEWTEPECAFSASPCTGQSDRFHLAIPAWEVEGTLEKADGILIAADATEQEGGSNPADGPRPQEGFWTSIRGIPQAKEDSPVEFCLLRGRLRVEKSHRAVYGIGLLSKRP